jgi:signal transduction histidine kinase
MSVRIRFVLLLTLIVSIILVTSLSSVYVLYERNRKQDFEKRLWAHAYTEFADYYNIKDTNKALLDKINYYFPSTPINFHLALYDQNFNLIKSEPAGWSYTADTSFFQKLKAQKEETFSHDISEGLAIYLNKQGKQAYVVATGDDKYSVGRLSSLRLIIIIVAISGILITGVFALYYVIIATKPLVALSLQMRHITENNLKLRVKVGKGNVKNNEIVQIATNFNDMLDRLERAFQLQKNFVHHASHELRTPLATMLSQTESALRKELTVKEAYRVLESLKEDQQEMIDLTNSLLLLSQYENINYSIHWPKVRIDELVHDVIATAKKIFPDINVCFDFVDSPEKESYLYFPGNETLLRSAVRNLIKNAYLYSTDKKVAVKMQASQNAVSIHVENKGAVLSSEDRDRMFLPFFRGDNAQNVKGFGLGLSIVRRIAELHKGSITYEIIDSNINRFTLLVKR